MEKKDAYDFLIRAAIPQVTEKAKLPKSCEGHGDLVWDAIYRAHRDVLTGRKYVTTYSAQKKESDVNDVAESLYDIIQKPNKRHLNPRKIINCLKKQYCEVNLGAIQKLVNMSLKYIFILQLFEKISTEYVLEKDLDCPLDSIILKKVKGLEHVKWTQLDDFEEYEEIQKIIGQQGESRSRIAFDFVNWPQFQELGN